jgi:UDP-N-acetylmuramyl tripeptide synthase
MPPDPPTGSRPRPSISPDPRLAAALVAAKLTGSVIRRLGRGGGTAAPGLVADRIDPNLLAKIARQLPQGTIVVAGTNGKTTVSRMLADILQAHGWRVAHNRSGSNLVRGVAATFAAQASLRGDPRADIGVIETDEAALSEIVGHVAPRVILLNNLFRDQLDRYGEINTIATKWRSALATLPAESTVVVNGDDPTLAEITSGLAADRLAFGLDDRNPRHHLATLPHAADAASCRRCGHDLVYNALYASHLGDWFCPQCGTARPPLDVRGLNIHLDGVEALRVTIDAPRADRRVPPLDLAVGIPGLYNAYNVVAVTAAARALGVPDATIASALATFRSAFGRIERITFRDRTLILALVKNPVGFNETLRMLTTATNGLTVPTLIAINDLDADGRDVSWLWDVDFELLANGTAPLATTGIRGADMANRLKYAGVDADRLRPLDVDLTRGLEAFVAGIPAGGTGYVLPTYTAMLGLRRTLTALGAVETFWKQ